MLDMHTTTYLKTITALMAPNTEPGLGRTHAMFFPPTQLMISWQAQKIIPLLAPTPP
jgi:hypothetical protein